MAALNFGVDFKRSPPLAKSRGRIQDSGMASIRIVEQLALFLENELGTLAKVCESLAEARINIYGLSMSDTIDHAVVRMVVSDSRKALAIFETYGVLVVEDDVLMIENENKPGSLFRITQILAEKKVNIEYCYLASLSSASKGLLILRVNNAKKAIRVLKEVLQS